MLYSQVRHIYGPLSPYLNALLYRIFGASLGVLYADNHLLVVNKPAMVPTMGVSDDRPSLLAVAKELERKQSRT